MSLMEISGSRTANPVDTVERMAATNDWSFARSSEDEVTLVITGKWTDYQVSFTWMGEIEALHLACAFDLKVPERRRAEMIELVSMINEQLWIGHFDLWANDGLVMFRHALVLAGGIEASGAQCESLLSTATEACERYYQAFQFVMWAGKSPRDALDAVQFETVGEA
ncbi:MAG: YbjN domain-containing protein [Rhodoplanes sp.]|uniref:YbjN domain-containing protein n=1 Tax=Rhodoplanes sp. TaxID=1968906 RepID=UPI001805BD38|nr:YbjN domain-containing protein [Rhodoplanes sp.]NVO16785.1 YbjN domain-containing protein [Rhodoplanes sp.]